MTDAATPTRPNCAVCGHPSREHAYSDSYESDPDPTTPVDFGPTHCHALGYNRSNCEDTVCRCPNFKELDCDR